eukprot:403356742
MGSPAKRLIQNVMYLLIMSSFLFDSYYKYTYLQSESDMLRSKYQNMQEYLQRAFPAGQSSFQPHTFLPNAQFITDNSQLIISIYAALQAASAIFVLLGHRNFSWILILLTLLQMSLIYNPYYKNSTEIDRQRAFKHIWGDLSLIAILIMCSGFKRQPKLKVKMQ